VLAVVPTVFEIINVGDETRATVVGIFVVTDAARVPSI
jgi:hypothetical protein